MLESTRDHRLPAVPFQKTVSGGNRINHRTTLAQFHHVPGSPHGPQSLLYIKKFNFFSFLIFLGECCLSRYPPNGSHTLPCVAYKVSTGPLDNSAWPNNWTNVAVDSPHLHQKSRNLQFRSKITRLLVIRSANIFGSDSRISCLISCPLPSLRG